MKPILTATSGNNAELFPRILDLYVPNGSTVADTTYGRGVFWRNVNVTKYVLWKSDLKDGTDARQLPYADNSCDAVVFDPPYMHSGNTVKDSLDKCYHNNGKRETWRDILPLYQSAAKEALRVLKPMGVLIMKAQDTVVNQKQFWLHAELLRLPGYICEDLFVLVQTGQPLMSGKWKRQYHARKNHSYFIVQRKLV